MAETEIKAVIFDCGRVFLHDPDNEVIFQDLASSCRASSEMVELVVNQLIPSFQRGELDEYSFWGAFRDHLGLPRLPDDYQELWTRKYLELGRVDEGVLTIVKELQAQGYLTPVLSNTIPPHVRVNRARGLFDLFKPEIFSCEVKARKGDGDGRIYQLALEESGRILGREPLRPEEAVYVDDLVKYVEEARRQNIYSIHFQNAEQLQGELEMVGIRV